MASNGKGRVRPGNSYYFLLLSISPGGQCSPVTVSSSRVRGAKLSIQKRVLKKAEKSEQGVGHTEAAEEGCSKDEFLITKRNNFLQ